MIPWLDRCFVPVADLNLDFGFRFGPGFGGSRLGNAEEFQVVELHHLELLFRLFGQGISAFLGIVFAFVNGLAIGIDDLDAMLAILHLDGNFALSIVDADEACPAENLNGKSGAD